MTTTAEVPEMEEAKPGVWVCPAHEGVVVQRDRQPECPLCTETPSNG